MRFSSRCFKKSLGYLDGACKVLEPLNSCYTPRAVGESAAWQDFRRKPQSAGEGVSIINFGVVTITKDLKSID